MNQIVKEECSVAIVSESQSIETTCWGCGLRLLLSSYTPIYKCGWCGAITNQDLRKVETSNYRWRNLRDRCFVATLLIFMLFVICGGVWGVYPVVFSSSSSFVILHCMLTAFLSVSTISSFSFSAFSCAGVPPLIIWGSYPFLAKGALENYTFCPFCSKPKSPRAHHCRSCGTCVLDMDHHCPFIGNCVGAGNHRYFIAFLISAVISTLYVSIMSAYALYHLWPPLDYYGSLGRIAVSAVDSKAWRFLKGIVLAFFSSAANVSTRELVLVYLSVASLSVAAGLTVLLGQQLFYIYEGKTYLSHLSSQGDDGVSERDCHNLLRFFGCSYPTSRLFSRFSRTKKPHKK